MDNSGNVVWDLLCHCFMLWAFLESFIIILSSQPVVTLAYLFSVFINYQTQLYLTTYYIEITICPTPIWKHYLVLKH